MQYYLTDNNNKNIYNHIYMKHTLKLIFFKHVKQFKKKKKKITSETLHATLTWSLSRKEKEKNVSDLKKKKIMNIISFQKYDYQYETKHLH